MSTICAVDECERPVPDTSFVCPRCGDRLAALLGLVPGILDDLDDVIRRQVRFTDNPGARTTERPLPYNPAASEVRAVLDGTLIFWTTSIGEVRGHRTGTSPLLMADYLERHVPWLRAQASGPEAFDELSAAIRQARRATDRPADRHYLGKCSATCVLSDIEGGGVFVCDADLFARDGDEVATCRACGADYPVADRRRWLLEQADDQLLPARELARAIDGLGVPLTAGMVAGMKRRRRILPHGVTPDGRDLFRVGDVRAVVEANAARRGDVEVIGSPTGG